MCIPNNTMVQMGPQVSVMPTSGILIGSVALHGSPVYTTHTQTQITELATFYVDSCHRMYAIHAIHAMLRKTDVQLDRSSIKCDFYGPSSLRVYCRRSVIMDHTDV